jgi:hypothetical protein
VNVDPMAALTLVAGATLPVRLRTIKAVDIATVLTQEGGQEVGVINAPETVRLIECLRAGRRYVATVVTVADPLSVRVQNE